MTMMNNLLKIKSWKKVKIHKPEKILLDEKLVGEAIFECLKDNDTEGFMEILEGYILALNKGK